jgi:molecular chaperone GrpE
VTKIDETTLELNPGSPSDADESLQSIDEAVQALEEANKKASENWDLFLRTRADADNMRRRALMDVENAHKYGIEKFARELLPVVDSLEHGLTALSTVETKEEVGLKEGIQLTYKLLLDALEKFGVKQINPLNEDFNPKLHEALTAQPKDDVPPNRVLLVVQKGFLMHDRLLRPARVIVSKAEEI